MNPQFHVHVHAERQALVYSLVTVVFFIVALIGKDPLVWCIPLLILAVMAGNYAYAYIAAKSIRFDNERNMLRLFPGDEAVIPFAFTNIARIPVVSASWTVGIQDLDGALGQRGGDEDTDRPLFLTSRATSVFPVTVHGVKRGLVRFPVLNIRIRDLLGLYTFRLVYKGYVRKEVCVYPESKPFHLPLRLSRLDPGTTPERMALFDEPTMPRGSRQYMQGDPFGKVAWKETARTGVLRTKEFERVVLTRWILVADLSGNLETQHIEQVYGQMTYAMTIAERRGIETEIWLNVRKAGVRPYLHLHPGQGAAHLGTVLHVFARLPSTATVAAPGHMYGGIAKSAAKGHVLLHFGFWGEDSASLERLLKRKGVPLHRVFPDQAVKAE